MRQFTKMVLILPLFWAACQSTDTSATDPNATPAGNIAQTQDALAFLKTGDVASAQASYDAALVTDPSNTSAAFGAAFTRMILFSESSPATSILADFAQKPMKASYFFGSSGYLSALKAFNDSKTASASATPPATPSTPTPSALVAAPEAKDYFPLATIQPARKRTKRLLSMATSGLKSTDLLSSVSEITPLMDKIADLLQQADQKNDFQFLIPKELFYGEKDIPLNRIDIKNLRAGISFTLFILHLVNSWDFPMTLSGLYDSDGKLLVSKQAVVDELNQFFTLKAKNELPEAQAEFKKALQLVLDGLDLQSTVTTDGVFEKDTRADAAYDELKTLAKAIQDSLVSSQQFPFSTPIINVDLNNFFSRPPDANSINRDPFVVENNRIKPVEAFFGQLLSQTTDIDFKTKYLPTFQSLKKPIAKVIFDEFINFKVAGSQISTSSVASTSN